MEEQKQEENKIKVYNNMMNDKPNKDRFYQVPERALLYAFSTLSAQALRLYIVLSGQRSGFEAEKELYTNRANIQHEYYDTYIEELKEEGFLIINNDNTITITCPQLAYNIDYEHGEHILPKPKQSENFTW